MITWKSANNRVLCGLQSQVKTRENEVLAALADLSSYEGDQAVRRDQLTRERELWTRLYDGLSHLRYSNATGSRTDVRPVWHWLQTLIVKRMCYSLAITIASMRSCNRATYREHHPYEDTVCDFLCYVWARLDNGSCLVMADGPTKSSPTKTWPSDRPPCRRPTRTPTTAPRSSPKAPSPRPMSPSSQSAPNR